MDVCRVRRGVRHSATREGCQPQVRPHRPSSSDAANREALMLRAAARQGDRDQVTFALRIPVELWIELERAAQEHGRSRNSEVLEAIKAHTS
jgi:hypothetical protein